MPSMRIPRTIAFALTALATLIRSLSALLCPGRICSWRSRTASLEPSTPPATRGLLPTCLCRDPGTLCAAVAQANLAP